MVVDVAHIASQLRGEIGVDAEDVIAARVRGAGGFEVVHHVGPRPGADKIGEWEIVEHGLASLVDAVGRDYVAGEWRTRIGIGDRNQRSIVLAALREIAGPFQSGGRVLVLDSAGDELSRVFLGPEEEQPVFLAVEKLRDEHRTTDTISLDI